MTLRVRTFTFDCNDARALAAFWSAALGWNVYFDDDPEVVVAPSFPQVKGGSPHLLFIPVPEAKTAKNRLHFDLSSETGTRDEEVERLLAVGARMIADHRTDRDVGWVVLADPEGNEFCVEPGDAERGTPAPRTFHLDTV